MRRYRWIVSAGVLALMLVYAARGVDWRRAMSMVESAAPAALVAATLLNLASLFLHAVRWWVFLRRIGVPSLALALRATVVGAGLNNVLVASGGDAARVLLVARAARVWKNAVLATVALDRLFDPICFVLLLLLASFVLPLPRAAGGPTLAGAVALLALLLLLALLIGLARTPERAIPAGTRGWRVHVHAFRRHVAGLSSLPRCAAALLLSAAIWAAQVATFALAARAVHIPIPCTAALAALLLTNAGLLLRATPGNIGVFQLAYAAAVRPFGVGTESAIAAALLLQLLQIAPVTLAAFLIAPRMLRQPHGPTLRRKN